MILCICLYSNANGEKHSRTDLKPLNFVVHLFLHLRLNLLLFLLQLLLALRDYAFELQLTASSGHNKNSDVSNALAPRSYALAPYRVHMRSSVRSMHLLLVHHAQHFLLGIPELVLETGHGGFEREWMRVRAC